MTLNQVVIKHIGRYLCTPLINNTLNFRNQSLDTNIAKDGSLLYSPNARSMPIPIANRTRSLDRYSSSETNLNVSPFHHDQFSRPGSAPGLMYGN